MEGEEDELGEEEMAMGALSVSGIVNSLRTHTSLSSSLILSLIRSAPQLNKQSLPLIRM